MRLATGTTFAGYTIIRLLGSGGMGEVYLAQHPRLPRQDALKILRTDVSADQDYRQRFIREADLAATLWHPNIVRVNDRGEFNGQLWIAMDFVDGTDAARLLRDHYPVGMPADEVAAIIAAIASALDYAHAHDLLHRDVKPANILLANPADGERRILLSDFGIARTLGDISGLTATNMTIGTLPYTAPEQLMDEPIDGRADQYALAATAYHLLTGSPLFPESNPAAVISRHLTAPPPALANSRPELAALDPVLAVALAKAPADRFPRCKDFAGAFAEVTHSGGQATGWASTMRAPIAAKPPPPPAPWVDGIERHRWPRQEPKRSASETWYPPAQPAPAPTTPVAKIWAGVALVAIAIALTVVVVGVRENSQIRTPSSGAPALPSYPSVPTPTDTVTAGPGTVDPGTADPGTAAAAQLEQLREEDRSYAAARLAEYWVPQLSSKHGNPPWTIDPEDGLTYTNQLILQEHQKFREKYDAKLLWTGDWTVWDKPDYWVTVVPTIFTNASDALRWCTSHDFDRDHCIAQVISATQGPNGTHASN
jgi:serine/threonine protein kinase